MKVLLEIHDSEIYAAKEWKETHEHLVEIFRVYGFMNKYAKGSDDYNHYLEHLLDTIKEARMESRI